MVYGLSFAIGLILGFMSHLVFALRKKKIVQTENVSRETNWAPHHDYDPPVVINNKQKKHINAEMNALKKDAEEDKKREAIRF